MSKVQDHFINMHVCLGANNPSTEKLEQSNVEYFCSDFLIIIIID